MEVLQDQSILIYVLLGTGVTVLLVVSIVAFVLFYKQRMLLERNKQVELALEYQRKMVQLQLESQENERKRIGADLHDSLGSLLWGIKVNMAYIQRTTALSKNALETHEEVTRLLDDGIQVVRRISWEISSDAFHYSGLSESVNKLCSQFQGKGINFQFQEIGPRVMWNDENALHVFRIIQELVSNAFKHSNGDLIKIIFHWNPELLTIIVSDNGRGIDQQQHRDGVGLWNVTHRIQQIKGEFSIGNPPTGTGTVATLKVYLTHEK